jgi:hypothetical protein
MMERRLAVFVRHSVTRTSLAGATIHAEAEFAPLFAGRQPEPAAPRQGRDTKAPLHSPDHPGLRMSLGMLVSDHAGFVSFDLDRLRSIAPTRDSFAQLRETLPGAETSEATAVILSHLWVAAGDADYTARLSWVDALAEGTGAGTGVVVLHLMLSTEKYSEKHHFGLAMQTPSLDEWYLSPGSFALAPSVLVGSSGCENIFPSNVATQEFRFRHLTRMAGASHTLALPESPTVKPGDPGTTLTLHLGFALDYLTTWYPLGHGLGQVAYSLPLAPCESVNIAVIDWSRRDEASRHEDLAVDEQLRHNLLRDRSIGETVKATLDEWQRGGSVMTGSGTAGSASMEVFSVGGTTALGGAYSTSSGTRDLAASTTQNLSDSIAQATNVSRKLDSTIVVQDMQLESATAKTRVVTNHNHAHAMTVLYYEVMRHFRVATEWVAQRPVAFISYDPINLKDEATVLLHRQAIQMVLLDASIAPCFDALQKLACIRPGFNPALIQDPPDEREMISFEVIVRTGGPDTDALPFVSLGAVAGPDVACTAKNPTEYFTPNVPAALARHVEDPTGVLLTGQVIRTAGEENVFTLVPNVRIVWGDIKELVLGLLPAISGAPWKVDHLVVKATNGDVTWQLYNGALPAGSDTVTSGATVRLPVTPVTGAKTPESLLTPDERCCIARLFAHLDGNKAYYTRAIWLAEDAEARAIRFDAFPGPAGAPNLLDLIENRPIGALGNSLVFPYAGPGIEPVRMPNERVGTERLLSLPTRGLFAEAMLGHCPSAEEINPTLFTDWASSPCPDKTTTINPVDTGSRAQAPSLTPSQLPNPVVNIVNPPAAPDPMGLAAALKVLGTPNIFRDMSAATELSQLLQTLVNNAASLVKSGSGTGGPSGGKPSAGTVASSSGTGNGSGSIGGFGSSGAGNARPVGTPQNVGEVNDLASGIRKQLPPAEANALVGQLYQGTVDAATSGSLDLQQVGDSYQRPAYTPQELVAIIGERIAENTLKGQGHLVFSDWRKHVSGTGFDMVSYDPVAKELWIIDNKAQFRGISGANALTGAAYARYESDLRAFLKNTWHVKAESDLALAALDAKRVKLVVANGFAGEATRFTKALFEQGLHAFDVRVSKLFSDHATWETMYKGLTLKKGIRLTGTRGAASVEANLLVAAVALGAGMFMLSSGINLKEIASDIAAQFAVDTLLSRLPGGNFAAFVIGMQSDETSEARQTRILNEQIDAIMYRIPGIDTVSDADKNASRDAARTILLNPIIIEDPTANNPKSLAPGFKWPPDPPSGWA